MAAIRKGAGVADAQASAMTAMERGVNGVAWAGGRRNPLRPGEESLLSRFKNQNDVRRPDPFTKVRREKPASWSRSVRWKIGESPGNGRVRINPASVNPRLSQPSRRIAIRTYGDKGGLLSNGESYPNGKLFFTISSI